MWFRYVCNGDSGVKNKIEKNGQRTLFHTGVKTQPAKTRKIQQMEESVNLSGRLVIQQLESVNLSGRLVIQQLESVNLCGRFGNCRFYCVSMLQGKSRSAHAFMCTIPCASHIPICSRCLFFFFFFLRSQRNFWRI